MDGPPAVVELGDGWTRSGYVAGTDAPLVDGVGDLEWTWYEVLDGSSSVNVEACGSSADCIWSARAGIPGGGS